jgi:hypothetical protein
MIAAVRGLLTSGYALKADGRLKAEFATQEGARATVQRSNRIRLGAESGRSGQPQYRCFLLICDA